MLDNFKQLIENSNTGVYITKADGYELLYVNETGLKWSKSKNRNYKGQPCYKFLNGLDKPCPFCKLDKMEKEKHIVREFTSPIFNKTFEMDGTIIEWNGEPAHIEYIRDVTEKKRIEDEKNKIKDELENIISHIPSGVCVYHFDGEKLAPVHHNEYFYKLLGYSDEHRKRTEIVTENLNVHPDDLDRFKREYSEGLRKGGFSSYKYRVFNDKKQDYMIIWLDCYVEKYEDGTATVYAQYNDVTEYETLKEKNVLEMRAFEEVERQMAQNQHNLIGTVKYNLTKDYVMEHDPNGMPVPTVENKTGIDEFGAIITPCAIGEGEAIKFADKFKRDYLLKVKHSNTNEPVSHEYRRLNKEGKIMWARTIAVFLDSPKDNDEYALVYTYDITEEKEKNLVVDYIVDNYFDFVAILDIKSDKLTLTQTRKMKKLMEDYKAFTDYEYINKTYSYALEEYVRLECDKKDQKEAMEAMSVKTIVEHLNENEIYTCAFTANESGKILRKFWQFSYFDKEKTKIIYTRTDITEMYQREMEANANLIIALQKAKEASLAKTSFLSRMSHDMRTPMNAILGFTDIGAEEKNYDEIASCFKNIKESGKYLLGLINDVLDTGKIEEDKIVLKSEPYGYEQFEESVFKMLRPKAEEKNIDFIIKNENPLGKLVEFDKMRFQQIFVNLIGNSIKFTPNGGCAELEIIVDKETTDGHIPHTFIIRDNGIGMSKKFVENKLFVPFEQEHNNVIKNDSGTGLGVPIAKKLVELMGGTITCESKLGEGTTFTIKLNPKLSDTTVKNETSKKVISYDVLKGKRILLCEDHPLNVKVAKKLLEKVGVEVVVAQDGQIGVDTFKNSKIGHFNAILMDIRMPNLDGLGATSIIRSLEREDAKTIPIIAMSANAFTEDVDKSLQAGMNAHLSKPIDINLLYKTLAEYLD